MCCEPGLCNWRHEEWFNGELSFDFQPDDGTSYRNTGGVDVSNSFRTILKQISAALEA